MILFIVSLWDSSCLIRSLSSFWSLHFYFSNFSKKCKNTDRYLSKVWVFSITWACKRIFSRCFTEMILFIAFLDERAFYYKFAILKFFILKFLKDLHFFGLYSHWHFLVDFLHFTDQLMQILHFCSGDALFIFRAACFINTQTRIA